MAKNIGIVGAGVAGVQLGLLLRQHGVPAVIYTDRSSAQQRAGRLVNVPNYFPHARDRERALGVAHWDEPDFGTFSVHVRLAAGPQPLAFRGDLERPAHGIDSRLSLPRMLEDFEERGGRVVVRPMSAGDVVRVADEHDLIVVCSGRGELAEMFGRIDELSPFRVPQRLIVGGIFHGVGDLAPPGLHFALTPHGEVLSFPFRIAGGRATAVAFEAIPGGAFDQIAKLPYADDPKRLEATMLELLRTYAPPVYERLDLARFALTGANDFVQGGLTPVVRHGHRRLSEKTFAMAIGDVHMVNDPLTAQGANLASHEAWILGHAILDDVPFDEAFCRRVGDAIWAVARPVMEWTNAMLMPPTPQMIGFLATAAQEPSVANAFANNFNDPARQWAMLSRLGG